MLINIIFTICVLVSVYELLALILCVFNDCMECFEYFNIITLIISVTAALTHIAGVW